ncbi:Uncharacterised protein [Nocardia africana]|uniref:Uncharacterized protein n=1 Tax=Nocardia africana TaxID=134964 RepID=A0A378X4N7_9NOCA|nr:Uncharacterised protein [Nocardia africana]
MISGVIHVGGQIGAAMSMYFETDDTDRWNPVTRTRQDVRFDDRVHRPAATRYDKFAARYRATVRIAAINQWLKHQ